MSEKPKDKNPWVVLKGDKPATKDLSLDGITQNRPRNLDPLQAVQGPSGNPVTVQPKPLDLQVAQSQITPDATSKLPFSPDVTRWNPPNITQPSLMGGPQTGAVAQPPPIVQPTPPAPADIKRVQTQKPP